MPRKTNKTKAKKMTIVRNPRWKETNTSRIKLHALSGLQIANDTTAETRGALIFQLANCNYFTRFTAIYDQYRIDKVVVRFRPSMATVVNRPYDDSTTAVSAQVTPRFVTAIDYDDNNTPASLDELVSRHNSRTTLATKPQTIAFKPKRLIQVYRTISSTGYITDGSKAFLDCAQTDIPHYGLKYALDTGSPIRAFIYQIDIEYQLTFTGLRH